MSYRDISDSRKLVLLLEKMDTVLAALPRREEPPAAPAAAEVWQCDGCDHGPCETDQHFPSARYPRDMCFKAQGVKGADWHRIDQPEPPADELSGNPGQLAEQPDEGER